MMFMRIGALRLLDFQLVPGFPQDADRLNRRSKQLDGPRPSKKWPQHLQCPTTKALQVASRMVSDTEKLCLYHVFLDLFGGSRYKMV